MENDTITKETNNACLRISIFNFYEVKVGKWRFTKQKQAFLSLNKLTNLNGASVAKDSLERKYVQRFPDVLLVGLALLL